MEAPVKVTPRYGYPQHTEDYDAYCPQDRKAEIPALSGALDSRVIGLIVILVIIIVLLVGYLMSTQPWVHEPPRQPQRPIQQTRPRPPAPQRDLQELLDRAKTEPPETPVPAQPEPAPVTT